MTGRQPHDLVFGQYAVVCRPIPDVVLCLVLWVHSRLHVEIMHLLSPRWPGGRSWLTDGAGSVHQRPAVVALECAYPAKVEPQQVIAQQVSDARRSHSDRSL